MKLNELLNGNYDFSMEKEINPQKIFGNLTQHFGYGHIRDIQSQILNDWEDHRDAKYFNSTIETGSGKTLIAFLTLMSKMNQESKPVMYLLPTRQLVNQVINEATKFGVPATDDVHNTGFWSGENILVTTFETLFNSKTIFNIEESSNDSPEIGTILIDDVHNCAQIAIEKTTLTIPKELPAYQNLFSMFKDSLQLQNPSQFSSIESKRAHVQLPVPYWVIKDNVQDILRYIQPYIETINNLKFNQAFALPFLAESQILVSSEYIQIRPRKFETHLLPSFDNVDHLILLSATQGRPEDYILGLGIPTGYLNKRIDLTNTNIKGGKKLIINSSDIFSKNIRKNMLDLMVETYPNGNIITLVPSTYASKVWENLGFEIVKDNIIEKVTEIKEHPNTSKHIVFINRYDGMDFPYDASHILFIDGLPNTMNNFDIYNNYICPETNILKRTQAQALEQGMGRTVRDTTDFSLIFLFGDTLSIKIKQQDFRKFLSRKLQAQITFGKTLIRMLKDNGSQYAPTSAIKDSSISFLNTEPQMLNFYNDKIIDLYEGTTENVSKDIEIEQELSSIYSLYNKHRYKDSDEVIQKLINNYPDISDSQKGVLLQLQAEINYPLDPSKANKLQEEAYYKNNRLLRPRDFNISTYSKNKQATNNQAKNIYEYITATYNNPFDFREALDIHLNNLRFSPKTDDTDTSTSFEESIDYIGKLLGFETNMPEKNLNCGPDNVWISGSTVLILESKNKAKTDNPYNKDNYGQLMTSKDWAESTYPLHEIIPIAVHSNKEVTFDIKKASMTTTIRVIDDKILNDIKSEIQRMFIALINSFDTITADEIKNTLKLSNLQHAQIINRINNSKLKY